MIKVGLSPLCADVLLVDFNGYTLGQDPSDNAVATFTDVGLLGSGVWNGLQISASNVNTVAAYHPGGVASDLVYADGSDATGVAITLSGFNGADWYLNGIGGLLFADYIGINNPTPTLTISGLMPDAAYDLAGYGSNGPDGIGALWTANGVGPLDLSKDTADSGVLANVPANGSGEIVITLQQDPYQSLHLLIVNGLELRPAVNPDCPVTFPEDYNEDCTVNLLDYAFYAQSWSSSLEELAHFARIWLNCTNMAMPDCWNTIEKVSADIWIKAKFKGDNPTAPFSFVYDGISSQTFLTSWDFSRTQELLDENRTKWTLQYTEPGGGPLRVTCEATEYSDYPAVEWVVYFENIGATNTAIIEDVQALVMNMNSGTTGQGSVPQPAVVHDTAADWPAAAPNPNGTWSYTQGWIATWSPMDTHENTTYPGLDRWSSAGGLPYIGKNTSAGPVSIDGASVAPGALVMKSNLGYDLGLPGPGSCAGLTWTCPSSGLYDLSVSLQNIGSGGNGVQWNLANGSTVYGWADLDNQAADSFTMTDQSVGQADQYILTFNARGDTTGDLTAVDFTATQRPQSSSNDEFLLHYSRGSTAVASDFQPMELSLTPGTALTLKSNQGRSSDGILPFFNIEQPGNTGRIFAIGWSGQWNATFTRDAGSNLHVEAGMELTHLRLYPGEKIRTPAMLLTFWVGDYRDSQNKFRRLMLDHYSPHPDGQLVDPPVAASVHGTYGFEATTETNMKSFTTTLYNSHMPVDYVWIDAGWYDLNGGSSWVNVGTWEPDPVRYPNGMQPVADWVHLLGFKFLVWFEPERVTAGSWLDVNHPNWIFKNGGGWWLLNLGNPDALAWVKSEFSGMIDNWGLDVYRHDFNVFPLDKWRYGEASDRQGMNEIKHIMGLYEFWDYLLATHPNLIIDNCASGGRRIDFEMLRRSLTLTRTDYLWYSDSAQAMQYALSNWVPLTGLGSVSTSTYDFRSGMGAHYTYALNTSLLGQGVASMTQYNQIRHYYMGDYYPLTPYSLSDDSWIAWQFDRYDLNEGMVQAFRRPNAAATSSMTFALRGLDPTANYTVDDLDTPGTVTMTGTVLMNPGLSVMIGSAPGSAIITYSKN